jgi:signal transduction histidine kinase
MALMTTGGPDARWPKLLSLAVHEFRTPITVVAGYIRMLLKERAGPLSEGQRRLLEEAEKSCGRLSALVGEMSSLSSLEREGAPLQTAPAELNELLQRAITVLPELPDREVAVQLDGPARGRIAADATRLEGALVSILTALRREVVSSDRLLVRARDAEVDGVPSLQIAIGDEQQIDEIAGANPADLAPFDEWRGGSGLSLAIARRIIGQHGGALLSPPGDGRAGAVVTLPRA